MSDTYENNSDDGDEYTYDDDDDDDDDYEMLNNNGNNNGNDKSKSKGDGKGASLLMKKITDVIASDGKYAIVDYSEITPFMDNILHEVSSMLDLDYDSAQILLQHCRWNKEKLMDSYLSSPEKLLKEAGLDLYSSKFIMQQLSSSSSSTTLTNTTTSLDIASTFKCRICCDDIDMKLSFSLGCDHKFCKPCYSEYLHNQIGDGPACIRSVCPEHKCFQAITKAIYCKFVTSESFKRYETYVMRNFIETSKNMKYCPAAGCDKVAIGAGITTVRCLCTNPFCFKCGEEAHEPCNCPQLAEWAQKCQNESETANWILAHTKKCPKCNARIEKNQGCNHMNCKLCKYEFCWICMGNWTDHGQNTGGYYKCNKYDAKGIEGNPAEKAKAELDRYLHYYQRYHGHDQSLKFASVRLDEAERKMVERQEAQKSTWIDVQFLKQAAEQVIECRRILKYTYVLGYFLEDNTPEKQLFEHHQEMLEKNTDTLHEFTEKPLEEIDRAKVVNLTRVTERFSASLLSSIVGGIVQSDEEVQPTTSKVRAMSIEP